MCTFLGSIFNIFRSEENMKSHNERNTNKQTAHQLEKQSQCIFFFFGFDGKYHPRGQVLGFLEVLVGLKSSGRLAGIVFRLVAPKTDFMGPNYDQKSEKDKAEKG